MRENTDQKNSEHGQFLRSEKQNLDKMKSCLIHHGHPEEVLDYTMTKIISLSSRSQNEWTDYVLLLFSLTILTLSLTNMLLIIV